MNTYAGKNVCWRTNILPLKDIYLLFSSHLNIHTDFSPDVQINPAFLDIDFNLKFCKVFSLILETLNNKLSKPFTFLLYTNSWRAWIFQDFKGKSKIRLYTGHFVMTEIPRNMFLKYFLNNHKLLITWHFCLSNLLWRALCLKV